jgi:hypothetical protein
VAGGAGIGFCAKPDNVSIRTRLDGYNDIDKACTRSVVVNEDRGRWCEIEKCAIAVVGVAAHHT